MNDTPDNAMFELKIFLHESEGDEIVEAQMTIPNGEQIIHHMMHLNLRTETIDYLRTTITAGIVGGVIHRERQHKSFFEGASLYGPMAQWLARGIGGIPRAYLTLTTPPITR